MSDPMAHPQRRSDDPQDGKPHRVLDAVESAGAKVVSRFVLPVLLAVIGFFLVRALNEITDGQRADRARGEEQSRDIAQIKSDVRNVNTRMDEGFVRQINALTEDSADHERRIQTLERTVKTP